MKIALSFELALTNVVFLYSPKNIRKAMFSGSWKGDVGLILVTLKL